MATGIALRACAFLGLVCNFGAVFGEASAPSMAFVWQELTLPAIQRSDVKPSQTKGPVELRNPRLEYRLGLKQRGSTLYVETASASLIFKEIVVMRPDVVVSMADTGKTLFGQKVFAPKTEIRQAVAGVIRDAGIAVDKNPQKPWRFPLPTTMSFTLRWDEKTGKHRVQLNQGREAIAPLVRAIDESLSNDVLFASLSHRLVNISNQLGAVVNPIINHHKAELFLEMRKALKQELEKTAFVEELERTLSEQLPVLAIGRDNLDGEWVLGENRSALILGPSHRVREVLVGLNPALHAAAVTNWEGIRAVLPNDTPFKESDWLAEKTKLRLTDVLLKPKAKSIAGVHHIQSRLVEGSEPILVLESPN